MSRGVVLMLLVAVVATTAAVATAASVDYKRGDGQMIQASDLNPLPVARYPRWSTDQAVTCSSASARTTVLARGNYVVTCPATAWGNQGSSSVTAVTLSDRRIPADYVYPVRVDAAGNDYVALVCTASVVCIVSLDI